MEGPQREQYLNEDLKDEEEACGQQVFLTGHRRMSFILNVKIEPSIPLGAPG